MYSFKNQKDKLIMFGIICNIYFIQCCSLDFEFDGSIEHLRHNSSKFFIREYSLQ